MARLLIVEDDRAMAVALRDGFEREGYAVSVATDGEAALESARQDPPELMILDLMLPKLSGHGVCTRLRELGMKVPIIMLTARSQEIDKVVGLKLGADDYLTKPFSFMELSARVEAVLRRTSGEAKPAGKYRFGEIAVDFESGEVTKAGKSLQLSARELRLLEYFVIRRGEVIDRDVLLSAVWDHDEAPLTRTVDVHVSKLRRKLEDDPANPQYLVTVHRAGYKFRG
jgi:two-component system, OmpR family, alkaline phosphatase synthesis response regulator PhoP